MIIPRYFIDHFSYLVFFVCVCVHLTVICCLRLAFHISNNSLVHYLLIFWSVFWSYEILRELGFNLGYYCLQNAG